VDNCVPWFFLNGAFQDTICGGGFVLYLSDHCLFHLKENVGMGTNKFIDLRDLFILLMFSSHWGCDTLQLYRYFRLVINHVSNNVKVNDIKLTQLQYNSHEITFLFFHMGVSNIFMELNQTMNKLSNEGTLLPKNQIIQLEFEEH